METRGRRDRLFLIAFGSNVGDRERWLRGTIERMDPVLGKILAVSSPYYNRAHVLDGQSPDEHPEYLNVVIQLQSILEPAELLRQLQSIETALGRDRAREGRWGDRTVDIDILACEDEVINLPQLILPHPRMHERDFVLFPLHEIVPDWIHPILKRSTRELIGDLASNTGARQQLASL